MSRQKKKHCLFFCILPTHPDLYLLCRTLSLFSALLSLSVCIAGSCKSSVTPSVFCLCCWILLKRCPTHVWNNHSPTEIPSCPCFPLWSHCRGNKWVWGVELEWAAGISATHPPPSLQDFRWRTKHPSSAQRTGMSHGKTDVGLYFSCLRYLPRRKKEDAAGHPDTNTNSFILKMWMC